MGRVPIPLFAFWERNSDLTRIPRDNRPDEIGLKRSPVQ
jgi:hypothetical protein